MSYKILIAYFSCTGTTKAVAQRIGEKVGGDLFEIVPEVPYTAADLNWRDSNSRSSVEKKDKDFRPAMVGAVENFDEYDTVFVGSPIWWYIPPGIISTFMEIYDFSGKTVIPFATSGSSGLGQTQQHLKSICPEAAAWKTAKVFHGARPGKDLDRWLTEIGLENA